MPLPLECMPGTQMLSVHRSHDIHTARLMADPRAAKASLTKDEEDGTDEDAPREHVLRIVLPRLGSQLPRQRVRPEVGQQQAAEEEEDGAVTGATGGLHLDDAHGLHVKV